MKDRGLALRCALVAIWFLFVAVDSLALTETVNGITWTYSVSGGEAIIGYYIDGKASVAVPTSTQGAVVIPSTLGNYPVGKIADQAFLGCSKLTSVTIPNGVTSIGYMAFQDCSGLTSVTIPDSVNYIGSYSFRNCIGLTSVTIPSGVTTIWPDTFSGCSGLTCITIPDSMTRISVNAFLNCNLLLDTTTIPGVMLVDGWAIGCNDSLSGDLDLTGIRGIAERAFINCTNLTNVVIPDSVKGIGGYAFYNCANLASVTIPNGVTSIMDRTFMYSGLRSITIPASVSSIDAYAFYYCSNLTSVTIPQSVCSSMLSHCFPHAYRSITDVTIGDNVTNIYDLCFSGCVNLTLVAVSPGNTAYKTIDGLLLSKDGKTLIVGVPRCGLTSVTIPDGITRIGGAAFGGCSSLTSVTIPDSVTNIGWNAFGGCSGLTSVTMPSRWALSSVFANSYTNIMSVSVPSGSTSVVDGAFKGCVALENVSIPDTVTSIGDEAFYNCSSLQQLTLPDGVTSYGVNCFEGCPAYTRALYRALFSGSSGGGSPLVVTTVVQQVEAPYALSSAAADRAIASVVVSSDCSIGSFVLKDGKVYDTMLYVSNTADHEVSLSLPSGYAYKTIKGATPLTIPASSQCIISITRVNANTFLVMREELGDVQ